MSWTRTSATTDDLLATMPTVNDRLRELHDVVWNESAADPAVLEVCRLRIAKLLGSSVDLAIRYEPATDAGLDEAKIAELDRWPTSDRYDERDRAALTFAEKFVIDPHSVTDEDCERLSAHFADDALAALTTALATFDALARLRVALDVAPPADAATRPTPTAPLP